MKSLAWLCVQSAQLLTSLQVLCLMIRTRYERNSMNSYRRKALSLWSDLLEEERWHKFESTNCKPSCKGWNGWAPYCECFENSCTFVPKGEIEDMELVIIAKPIDDVLRNIQVIP